MDDKKSEALDISARTNGNSGKKINEDTLNPYQSGIKSGLSNN